MAFLFFVIALLIGLAALAQRRRTFSFTAGFSISDWFLISAQALTIALQIGMAAWTWLSKQPQVYSDFIPGAIGLLYKNKTSEYQAIYLAIVSFVLLLALLTRVYDLLLDQRAGVRSGFYQLGMYALIPAALMLGQSLRMKETPYLMRTSFLVLLLLLAILFFLRRNLKKGSIEPEQTFAAGSRLMLGGLFLFLSDSGAALLLSRLGHPNYQIGILTLLGLAIITVFFFINRNERFLPLLHSIDLFFALSQLGAPLVFAVLASPPVLDQNGALTFISFRSSLYIVLGILGLASLVDIVRRLLKVWRAPADRADYRSIVSPWTLISALLILQHVFPYWPAISTDEYHSSEFYIPWWSLTHFGELPFVQYQPSRGLLNYIPGMLSWLFLDGSMSSHTVFAAHNTAVYIIPTYFCLRKMIGSYTAFLSVFSVAMFAGAHSGGIMIAIAAMALFFHYAKEHSPVANLWAWAGLSLITTLFSASEGAAFILSSLPLVAYLLYQAYRRERRKLWISFGALALLLPCLLLPIAPSQIVLGVAHYLIEQSGVNDIAHAIAWAFPSNPTYAVTTGYLWQILRYSWLLMVVPIAVLLLKPGSAPEDSRANGQFVPLRWLFLIAMLIFTVVIIQRGNGRVDTDADFSRPGITSIALITCALPLIILPAINEGSRHARVVLLLALVFGFLGLQENSLDMAWHINKQIIHAPRTATTSSASTGLYNIGENAIVKAEQIARQQNIQRVLDRLLAPEETYYDGTNRGASYVFQDRRNPVADTAYYNAPTSIQQRRAIAELEKQKVPLALVWSQNITYSDGPSLSLRGFWIYQYLMDNYRPFIDENEQIWMIRKGEEQRLSGTSYTIAAGKDLVLLLTQSFWIKDLYGLPAAWGASYDSLADKLVHPLGLLNASPSITAYGMEQVDKRTWKITGTDPYLIIDIPSGGKRDMLVIEIAKTMKDGNMQVLWTNELVPDFNEEASYTFTTIGSRFIVPLAAAPSWYLSTAPRQIRINLPDTFNGYTQFRSITLTNRLKDQ